MGPSHSMRKPPKGLRVKRFVSRMGRAPRAKSLNALVVASFGDGAFAKKLPRISTHRARAGFWGVDQLGQARGQTACIGRVGIGMVDAPMISPLGFEACSVVEALGLRKGDAHESLLGRSAIGNPIYSRPAAGHMDSETGVVCFRFMG